MTDTSPAFDLVVATVDRTRPLEELLASLEAQTYPTFRVVVVDQNDDERVAAVLARHPRLEVDHVKAPRGLSRARNAALPRLRGEIVAFPDDDCTYPPGVLREVACRFEERADLDALCGRLADEDGRATGRWRSEAGPVTASNVWFGVLSATLFVRRALLERIGGFDEALGLGAGTSLESGEETELVVRALRAGAAVAYDPAIVVRHSVRERSGTALMALGRREGAGVGYVLGRHGYPASVVARMLIRPVGGAVVALARANAGLARFHLATLHGRVEGLRDGRRARRSL